MRARIRQLFDELRASYWFVPTVMTLGAAALAGLLLAVDGWVGGRWPESLRFLTVGSAENARQLLTTTGGSMLGVAGVAFSTTIAAVVYATGQHGPRLLTNFMRDRGNQLTLGTFIATFVYCLLTLRAVRGPGSGEPFVPEITLLVSFALAVASVGVLIYFIHHVAASIHVSNLIAAMGHDLAESFDAWMLDDIGEDGAGEAPSSEAHPVRAVGSGYVQNVSGTDLLGLADTYDLVVEIVHLPCAFAAEGDAVLRAWPRESVTKDVEDALRASVVVGSQRTPTQDAFFAVDELVEIATRALSSGINDPFTAMACMDWLASGLKRIADRPFPSSGRHRDGILRIVAPPPSWDTLVYRTFGQLRSYVTSDPNAAGRALTLLAEIGLRTDDPERRDTVRREIRAFAAGALQQLAVPADREQVELQHREALRALGSDYSSPSSRSSLRK